MKKVDKIVIKSFLGPFLLTMLVVVFILLTQHMLKYFDDLVGKDLGWAVLGKLIFYFAIFVTPFAFPLGVLLSSLMTFGNLGEHSELTAIKSGGISLPRTMRSIFIFIIFLTGIAFLSNNYFVPRAALEAYSLMWDIKRKKPSLDLPEGEFYGGIEDYRIRVENKDEESGYLKDLIIYDHTDKAGNNEVTIADSGKMTTIMNERYLKLELYSGHSYAEGHANQQNVSRSRRNLRQSFSKVKFDKSELIFDLSSFDLQQTDKDLFKRNRLMRNIFQIEQDIDSLEMKIENRSYELYINSRSLLSNYFRNDSLPITDEVRAYQRRMDSIREYRMNREMRNNPEINVSEEDYKTARTKPKENTDNRTGNTDQITNNPTQKPDSAKPTETESTKQQPVLKNRPGILQRQNREKDNDENTIKSGKQVDIVRSDSIPTHQKQPEKDPEIKPEKSIVTRIDSLRPDKNITNEISKDSILKVLENVRDFETGYVNPGMDTVKFNSNLIRKVRTAKNRIHADANYADAHRQEIWIFEIQYHKIIANSVACIIMFLIGAPLGSIIKKGGLGFPVLISILFFIIYYVLMIMGEKWAKTGLIDSWLGIWQANLILLPFGIFFLIQAQRDARLFDMDFYNVFIQKVNNWLKRNKLIQKLGG